jgi:hypothetical protein
VIVHHLVDRVAERQQCRAVGGGAYPHFRQGRTVVAAGYARYVVTGTRAMCLLGFQRPDQLIQKHWDAVAQLGFSGMSAWPFRDLRHAPLDQGGGIVGQKIVHHEVTPV